MTSRRNTPPKLKWLLNERAAVVGTIDLLDNRAAERQKLLKKFEEKALVLRHELQGLEQRRISAQAQMEAFDYVLRAEHPNLDVAAAGKVRGWANKHGKRGALKDFVIKFIREASPQAVSTTDIRSAVLKHFGLELTTPLERERFCGGVTKLLSLARREGLIERLPTPAGSAGLWRLTQPPGLRELLAAAKEGRCDPNEDLVRG